MITKSLLFNPSVTLIDVGPIEIRDDSLSERRKDFSINISSIEAISYNIPSVRTAVQGDPVKIMAYDNDCEYLIIVLIHTYIIDYPFYFPDKVGFAVDDSDVMLTEGASRNICVKILDLQPSDIYPMINIPLSISTSNLSAGIVRMHNYNGLL